MFTRFALAGIGLAAWLSASSAWAAPPVSRTFIRDVNCTPTRITLMYRNPIPPWPGYSMPYYQPTVAFLPTSPPMTAQTPSSATPASPGIDIDRPTTTASTRSLPRPSGIADKKDDDGTVATNRMRFIELTVTGVNAAGDSAALTAALDKLQGSRGSSVKRLGGGEATVKVWYSEKDPLAMDAVVQEVAKLGFKVARS
jgi:hypothetical protein